MVEISLKLTVICWKHTNFSPLNYGLFFSRVMEQTFTHTMNIMKENGMQISEVAGEECILLMVQFMRENGTIT